ncbi:anthranilate synthase component I family protein [Candidatus Micrarchaeota archaeon]|nr:anthranilate synthase component I family protein [Candidatus Micrarchaeota archaeon]
MYVGMHSQELELQISPLDMYCVLCEHAQNAFLLESAEGPRKLARFSFLGFSPKKHIVLKNGIFEVNGERQVAKKPLQQLKAEIGMGRGAGFGTGGGIGSAGFEAKDHARGAGDARRAGAGAGSGAGATDTWQAAGFVGGAVGYFSFEYARHIENLPAVKDELGFPDFEFGIFEDAMVYDHLSNSIRYVHRGESRLEEIMSFVKGSSFESQNFQMYNKKCNVGREKFIQNVQKAKEYISAGDAFQIVLSKRHEIKYSGSLLPFYRKLKATNPSPYMFYVKFGEREVIGSSPENLVRVEGNKITSYATLAGTRARGKTPAEDEALEKELLADEKERAEHLMLVDLTRNDVGKVAAVGSVKVQKFMEVHKYSHVQHIASLVEGDLAQGKDCFDTFEAIFPAGTVSGAPKKRAMEIIGEIEGTARGPYAGAVGYFSSNGNADFAITIRTLFASRGKAYVQSGAGIVHDSVAQKEYEESENKARALLNALGDEKYERAVNGGARQ